MNNYVVATIKYWNIEQFRQNITLLPGSWHLITKQEELNLEQLKQLAPIYIFFPHWSWMVPKEIIENFNCVCFHMTDLPYGRGGSPLQNLIIRGFKETKLTALKMEHKIDAGPIYMKVAMSLEGSATDVFLRCSQLTFKMIRSIVELEPDPIAQQGHVVEFKRRTPQDSQLPKEAELYKIFDIIRMLDAETYPHAFLNYGQFRLNFQEARFDDPNNLSATVTFKKREDN